MSAGGITAISPYDFEWLQNVECICDAITSNGTPILPRCNALRLSLKKDQELLFGDSNAICRNCSAIYHVTIVPKPRHDKGATRGNGIAIVSLVLQPSEIAGRICGDSTCDHESMQPYRLLDLAEPFAESGNIK